MASATQEEIDRRYAEKVSARAEGRAPVFVAAPVLPTGISKADIDARYLAKLAGHGKPVPAPVAAPAPPAEPKGDKPESKAKDEPPKAKGDKPKA